MLSEVLRFESSILHYGISSNEEPYSGQVGQLTVRELFSPPTDPKLPPAIHNYQVIIEATVATREEGWKAKLEAHELVHDLDRAWVYVCGRPLHPLHTQLYLDEPSEGWSTKAKEIDARLAHAEEGLYATLEIEQGRHWMQLPFFPLSEALKVRRVLKTASEVTLALTDLHYNALKSLDNHSNLFLLAKALELGNRLLAGKDKKAREKSLPEDICNALRYSLDWLFIMSNQRFDVRYVVKNPQGPQLHQRMTPEERITFAKDADLVIRAIVCQQIGRSVFIVKQQ